MHNTKREISPDLENILGEKINILDHGFIRVVDYMGNDSSIVQAARVSYGKGTKQVNQDQGLINYLMRHRHTTPFEMCEIKFHVKLPIFVARQWIRHRTGSFNEYSARYSILGKEFYLPSYENLTAQSVNNKQGRSDNSLDINYAQKILDLLKSDALMLYDHYLELLNENERGEKIDENVFGIARELARMNLSLNYYTEWYWKVNLHNLLHFLSLRTDKHAQYEIRVYADAILDIVKKWVPFSYHAFEEYRRGGIFLSKTAASIVKKMIKGEKITQEDSGMSKGEWREFITMFDL